jgi:pimeloyl-ACP methyl ester carboxylesterase
MLMKVNVNTGTGINERIIDPVRSNTGQVTSTDGTIIGFRQVGHGLGLVILHGGIRASQHYLRLAQALANVYTVYIPDRRGRGLSGPPGDDYSIQKELEDLQALLQKSGACMLFGHSAGGFFALEAALKLPMRNVLPVLSKEIDLARRIEMLGLDHNAPDQNAPEAVAAELRKFFTSLN